MNGKHPTTNIQRPTPKASSSPLLEVGGWFLLNSGAGVPAFNMALDEALLEAMPCLQKPILRFYGWNEPAASFGYFQKYAEAERATVLRPLIRRPTGGGIVPHDADWTYSFAVPAGHEWHSLKAEESYRRIHEWIRSAFTEMKIETTLAACGQKSAPGQCFAGHEKFDLLWNGRKIAGAAQRRNKLGLLIQGSIQPSRSLARAEWERAMCGVAERGFGIQWAEFVLGEELNERAEKLMREKFSQNRFTKKR